MVESEQRSKVVWAYLCRRGERKQEDQVGSTAVSQVRGNGAWTKMLAVGVGRSGCIRVEPAGSFAAGIDRAGKAEEVGAPVSGLWPRVYVVGDGADAEMESIEGETGGTWEQMQHCR